ncbi:MAG: hypothetical protein PHE83_19010, partial [Opitutaceae bacterium]|nr:hypothetical protein [Opitutaceae bacterium]
MLAAVPAFNPTKVATGYFGAGDTPITSGGTLGTSGTLAGRVLFGRWGRLWITEPGPLHLTKAVTYLNLSGAGVTCDQMELIIVHCRPDAVYGPDTLLDAGTEVFYKLLGTGPWSAAGKVEFALNDDLVIPAAAVTNRNLYYTIARRKPAGATGVIGDRRYNVQIGPNVGVLYNNDAASIRDLLATHPGSTGYQPLNRLEFTTKSRVLYSFAGKGLQTAAQNNLILPRITDQTEWLKMEGVVGGGATDSVGLSLRTVADDGVTLTEIGGCLLNFDAKTVGFGAGATRNTYAMGDGDPLPAEAYNDAGRDIYLAMKVDGKAELFDCNRTPTKGQGPIGGSDRAMIAHGVAYGEARNNPITLTGGVTPEVLVVAGAAGALCKLQFGWRSEE